MLEVEDELDKGEEACCDEILVEKADDGEIHLHLYWVKRNWRPGEVYELMLKDKLRQEGCELEVVHSTPSP